MIICTNRQTLSASYFKYMFLSTLYNYMINAIANSIAKFCYIILILFKMFRLIKVTQVTGKSYTTIRYYKECICMNSLTNHNRLLFEKLTVAYSLAALMPVHEKGLRIKEYNCIITVHCCILKLMIRGASITLNTNANKATHLVFN